MSIVKKAIVVLEDGTTYEGKSIGANGATVGKAVFSTCTTGYQEVLTDPSFAGQILTYAVEPDDLKGSVAKVAHINLNDGTVEGLRHTELPIFSIQYHPEASPGSMDSSYLFRQFLDNMVGCK